MNKVNRFYRLLNILSIDVALGSVCCAAWFAGYFEIELRAYAFLCLGLTVWIIYTADHLLDALKIKKEASTARHRFHQRYFKIITVCLLIAVVVDFSMLFFIRARILYTGITLSAIVILYLLVNPWLSFVKEFVIALVYSAGVLLPTLSLKGQLLTTLEFLWIISFFLTALINLILFSVYDSQADKHDGYNSFVLKFGTTQARRILIVLFSIQFLLLMVLVWNSMWSTAVMLLAMNSVLLLLFAKQADFSRYDTYRLCGDAVFLVPVVFMLVR